MLEPNYLALCLQVVLLTEKISSELVLELILLPEHHTQEGKSTQQSKTPPARSGVIRTWTPRDAHPVSTMAGQKKSSVSWKCGNLHFRLFNTRRKVLCLSKKWTNWTHASPALTLHFQKTNMVSPLSRQAGNHKHLAARCCAILS